jgi:hypothetical protein
MAATEGDDLESFWQVVRRNKTEKAYPQTMHMAEGIERIVQALEAYTVLYGKKVEHRPHVTFNPTGKPDAPSWTVTITYPNLPPGVKPYEKPTLEEALEASFTGVIKAIQTQIAMHRQRTETLRKEIELENSRVTNLDRILLTMGNFNSTQGNLPLLETVPPPPPAAK